jgi:hypothetical protein
MIRYKEGKVMNLVGKVIAVDLCNTVADINSVIESRLGKNPDPTNYIHPALYPTFFEENLDIFLIASPLGESAEILQELSKYNRIVYITARPKVAGFVTKIWLRVSGYPKGKVYFTDNKVEVAKKLGVTLAVEDAPHEIELYHEAGIEVLVKATPYNKQYRNRFAWGSRDNAIELLDAVEMA